ncbi:hypothetical protein CALVIDRAFT_34515 [Calocera viscosa TUFC12733]|uniref:Uncharacterized protein n=1 Tax=Calocera viscosa (strain TUFC12733) TaxID=1330018 RepID=A0A167FP64_CALVF|nr:hypothetical protein CALVIDRAFT_34515 [Calocera viscosa TUFC12733]
MRRPSKSAAVFLATVIGTRGAEYARIWRSRHSHSAPLRGSSRNMGIHGPSSFCVFSHVATTALLRVTHPAH